MCFRLHHDVENSMRKEAAEWQNPQGVIKLQLGI